MKLAFPLLTALLLAPIVASAQNSATNPASGQSVSQDDPPLLLYCKNAPVPPGQPVEDTSHTANYGVKFAEHCREVGMDCLFIHPGVAGFEDRSVEKYLIQKLSAGTDSK